MTYYLSGKRKEKGVVLLSCLVFLLILLIIVRFAVTSSRLEERKAGADYEMMTARQAAQTAIRQAEKFILEQGLQSCIRTAGANIPGITAGGNIEAQCKEKNPAELANIFWKAKDANELNTALTAIGQPGIVQKGIYTYSFIKTRTECRPFWICVNWSQDAKSVLHTSKQLNRGATNTLESLECNPCGTLSGIKPRFIIERFLADDLKEIEFSDLATDSKLSLKSKEVVVFRITTVGFGNGDGGNNVNTTNAVMQAIYILNG